MFGGFWLIASKGQQHITLNKPVLSGDSNKFVTITQIDSDFIVVQNAPWSLEAIVNGMQTFLEQ